MVDTSERELVYENDIASMYWYKKDKCVEIEAKASNEVGLFRSAMEKVLELVKQRGADKIMADASQLGKISDEDVLWTETDWVPSGAKAGVKRIAVVPPKRMASYLAIEKMATEVGAGAGGFERRFFSDPEEARKWLTS